MDSVALGWLMWIAMFMASVWIRRRVKSPSRVSGNTGRRTAAAQTGPKWEQIAPLDECFEEDDW